MRNIRILTMNIQAQAWPAGPHSDAKWRAIAVIKALNPANFEFDEIPDVVVFNEADNEDAKELLETGLKDMYPHFIVSFNGGSGDLDDSGLAIFSKFELVTLPPSDNNDDNNKSRFYPYNSFMSPIGPIALSAGSDSYAEKGVAIVQLSTGIQFEHITLAFTHMQAFYKEPGEHHEIRLRQLKVIENGLITLLGPPENNSNWDRVIIMGDMNIRGDKPPFSNEGYGEWTNVFINNGGPLNNALYGINTRQNQLIFTENLVDSWRNYMKSPSAFIEADLGLTNTNLKAGENLPALLKERLDYICLPKERVEGIGITPRRLVAQCIRILPNNSSDLDAAFEKIQSDHKGLLAQLHWNFLYNTPSNAKLQSDFNAHSIPNTAVKLNVASDLNIASPGVYQWIYIDQPGTYTFNCTSNMLVSFYYEDNISTKINPYEKIKISDLGLDNLVENIFREFRLNEEGVQVDVHKPMFIKIKADNSNSNFEGRISFSFIKHTGENRFLAIGLIANELPKNPRLPMGQKNGPNDECWFRAPLREELFSKNPYPVKIYVKNDFSKKIEIKLFESIDAVIPFEMRNGVEKKMEIDFLRISGTKDIYLLLNRSEVTDIEFTAGFVYSISFLNYIEIYSIEDQSGLGADEIHLMMKADNMATNFIDFIDEDFDENERRELNAEFKKISNNIAFENQLSATVFELDGGDDDDGPFNGTIGALHKGEKERNDSIIIEADGARYQIIYKISRQPNN